MLRNYLIITIRNIVKQKTYSFINIAGLAVGLASFILIVLWVQDEFSFDRFHENTDNIYRVVNFEKYSNEEEMYFSQTPAGLAPILKSDFPEIKEVTRVRLVNDVIFKYQNKTFNEENVIFADPSFFLIFSFQFDNQISIGQLNNPYSILITKKMADKYFGLENPLGKTLKLDNKLDLIITGVLENPPANSHIQFNFIIPFERIKDFGYPVEGFNSYAYATYVLLDQKKDYKFISSKIKNTIKKHDKSAILTSSLQSIKDIHLYSSNIGGLGGDGDIKYIYIFFAIAIFVLLTACINFMNLSTARSGKRAKEVGLRKVIGANRKAIILQFFNESLIISFFAMIFAYLIVMLVLPAFNSLSGTDLYFSFAFMPSIHAVILITTLFTGIISGSYPALILSSIQPIKTIKGVINTGKKGTLFRRILVSIQFVLTICLIFGTIVINRQLHFVKTQKLGYDKEQVLSIALQGELSQMIEFLKNELNENTDIENISATTSTPSAIGKSFIVNHWQGNSDQEKFLANLVETDENFLEILNLDMVCGRYFSKEFISDSSAVIINEAALSLLGFDDPLGKSFMKEYHVIGVVKDFHFQSLHKKIAPLIIFHSTNNLKYLLVKIQSTNLFKSLTYLENQWNKMIPNYPMEFQFLDEQLDRQYRSDRQTEKIINVFTFLTIFISVLGLTGMASYIAELRTKEIGIRKVLGATITGILTMLSKEFIKWILIAVVIAFPISWYVMNQWLQTFAYHMELNIWLFLLSGIMSLLVALITILFQTFKTASANPIKSLKYE
jgi:ABC-type antimicrobial peptide transport system permease subunit